MQIAASFRAAAIDVVDGSLSPISGIASGVHVSGTDAQLTGAIVSGLIEVGKLAAGVVEPKALSVAGMRSGAAFEVEDESTIAASIVIGVKPIATIQTSNSRP